MLLGAGAVLGYDLPDDITQPSTERITNEVCNPENYENIDISIITIIKSKLEKLGLVCNFEVIFHVLEQIKAYKSTWDTPNVPNRNIPFFAPFTQCTIKASMDNFDGIMNRYVQLIMDIVNDYNEYYINNQEKEKWYGRLFVEKDNWDIFNLNYDTTIEHCLREYEDGFEEVPGKDYCKFNPGKLYENHYKKSTINHLHGCILYDKKPNLSEDINFTEIHDLYKFNSYKMVCDRKKRCAYSNPINQAGESYFGDSIITGLHKTDKIVHNPYQFYLDYLTQSIVNNNALIIVGYSFGDIYINNIIRSMNFIHGDKARVVLIDRLDDYYRRGSKCCFDCYINRNLSFSSMGGFIKNISDATDLSYKNFKDIGEDPICSINGRLMFFVEGYKEALCSYEKILDFLKS